MRVASINCTVTFYGDETSVANAILITFCSVTSTDKMEKLRLEKIRGCLSSIDYDVAIDLIKRYIENEGGVKYNNNHTDPFFIASLEVFETYLFGSRRNVLMFLLV